jgi:signal transduction histidine kinase
LLAALAAVGVAELLGPLHIGATGLRSAIETVIILSALVTAVLLRTRFRYTRSLGDLLLLAALASVLLMDLMFSALPAFSSHQIRTYGMGARIACSVLVASTFVAAAFAPTDRRIRACRRQVALATLAAVVLIGICGLIGRLVGAGSISAGTGVHEPFQTAVLIASCVGLLAATFGFVALRGRRDPQAGLLAATACLLAGAWLERLALPLVPADWVTPALLIRLAAYGLMLAVAVRLYVEIRQQLEREAISAERLRIAHELHDELAQDLAFIAAYADRLSRELGAEHPLGIAAKRALTASRGTILDLEASDAPGIEAALREIAAEVEARFPVEVSVQSDDHSGIDPAVSGRPELVRIAREAIANAVCHGGACRVVVTIGARGGNSLLRISDDGCGIDDPCARANPGTGLGMRMMQAQARAIGGKLVIRRGNGGGTEIAVIASRSGASSA